MEARDDGDELVHFGLRRVEVVERGDEVVQPNSWSLM